MSNYDPDEVMDLFIQLTQDSDFTYRDSFYNRIEFTWWYPDFEHRLELDFWFYDYHIDVYLRDNSNEFHSEHTLGYLNLSEWNVQQIHAAITAKHNLLFAGE